MYQLHTGCSHLLRLISARQNKMETTDHKIIIRKYRTPTKEAADLKEALESKGVRVLVELHDGHKTIDLAIPKAKINVEVDGLQHLTDPEQIVSDLSRGYYSHKNGYDTIHIPNEMVRLHL